MKSALIYPREKFVYDFLSGRHEAYLVQDGPGEVRDRFGVDADLSDTARRRVAAYRDVRAVRRRYVLRPEVLNTAD